VSWFQRPRAARRFFLLDITEKNSLQLGPKDNIPSLRLAQDQLIYESFLG
jgi:hypothetical protein